jgi:hypothetical protein
VLDGESEMISGHKTVNCTSCKQPFITFNVEHFPMCEECKNTINNEFTCIIDLVHNKLTYTPEQLQQMATDILNNMEIKDYEELHKGISKDELTELIKPLGFYRLHELKNGDVFTYKDVSLEYENNLFYEVKDGGLDGFLQKVWIRTGKVLTIDEINNFS